MKMPIEARRSINRGMIVLGAPAGGLLADAFGYRAMLYTAAAGFLIVSATLAASRFRTARIDDATSPQKGSPNATIPIPNRRNLDQPGENAVDSRRKTFSLREPTEEAPFRILFRSSPQAKNAGIGTKARINQQDADQMTRLINVSLVGPLLCAKHAVQMMSTAYGGTGGSIVNIASAAARTGGRSGIVPYAATKDALVTFTRGLSNEVASEGIRVKGVSPGIIATDAITAVPDAETAAAASPLGRMGRPDEVAATVSWLISPAASFITGSDITVSGGR